MVYGRQSMLLTNAAVRSVRTNLLCNFTRPIYSNLRTSLVTPKITSNVRALSILAGSRGTSVATPLHDRLTGIGGGIRYESSSAAAAATIATPTQTPNIPKDGVTPAATRFDEITCLHSGLQKSLKSVFRYEVMSPVQSMVLSSMPITTDLLVRAETGTGKTLAFLLPTIDQMLQQQTVEDYRKGKSCRALIISPTRELALQIADEANRLCSRLPMQVRCFVGGENRRNNVRDIESRRIDLLVATPGRLEDLLESERLLKEQMGGLQMLILDEADTLLEMGFREALTRIIDHLPENRRTMLFSATLSSEVKKVVRIAFRNEHKLIDTIGYDKKPHVPERIRQGYLMAPSSKHPEMLRRLLARHGEKVNHPGKVIVFFPTTKSTMLYADLFRSAGYRNIFEIHSKRDQKQRQRVADRFREAHGPAILFTSDVSARGVDYPGVTLVVQMGASAGSDQYVHRCGRTGRAGQEGRAIGIYAPLEREFVNTLSDLGLRHDPELEARLTVVAADALAELDPIAIEEAYTAYLGFYVGRTADLCIHNKQSILDESAHYVKGFGMSEPPSLSANFLERIGFSAKSMRRESVRDNRFNRRGPSSFGGGGGGGYDRGNRSSSFDRFDRNNRSSSSSFDRFNRDGGNNRTRSFSGSFNRDNDRHATGSFNRFNRGGSGNNRSHSSEEQATRAPPRGFRDFN
ncbi:P-loop containing nucleoside triphosphate hydrolase protein [Syncephalis plumigaleata]|nr:P-loop containing nucleoside triphosphate hydrolase protein [Syncephalis plumigaleata]